jgi:membrane fusion protein (multidrug efflux system)
VNLWRSTLYSFCLLGLCAVLISCDSKKDKAKHASSATSVSALNVTQELIRVPHHSSGTLKSVKNSIIRAQVIGSVKNIFVRTGATVYPQEKLVQLDNTRQSIAIKKAKADYATVKESVNEKKLALRDYENGYRKGAIPRLKLSRAKSQVNIELQRLKAAEQAVNMAMNDIDRTLIRSPIEGHVQKIFVSVGDFIKPGDPTVQIINPQSLQAVFPFPQQLAKDISIGQTVKISSPATPGQTYLGQITDIEPSIDPNNRTFNVILRFANSGIWKSGSSINAEVFYSMASNGYIVPKRSVVLKKDGDYIFYIENNKALSKKVEILHSWKNRVAVKGEGLPQQFNVIVDGAPYLNNGAAVKITKQLNNANDVS